MDGKRINQKLVVPLFNIDFEKSLQIDLSHEEFLDGLTAFVFPEPIPVVPLQAKIKAREGNEPIPTPLPTPRTTIRFLPWGDTANHEDHAKAFLSIQQLPPDFDLFDNLGPFAFRPGPGGLGGFQTSTTAYTKLRAKGLLIVEFDQTYPENLEAMVRSSNPYESTLVESLLDGLRLFSGNEPHQYKGFHLNNDRFIDVIIKWPLMEVQGTPVKLDSMHVQDFKSMFLQMWQIRRDARRDSEKNRSCTIINLALEDYYLASAMTELRTTFLHLMIAFEALFKNRDEESAAGACSRLAELLAQTKVQYNEINRFMWDAKGCCKVRNQIVHGDTSALSSAMYWRLKALIRAAIARIAALVLSSQIDRGRYYESLGAYVNESFALLPNS
jgi:hypothetical protein